MKKELFNKLLASETTEELVDLIPYSIKRNHLLTTDNISSVFRSESKINITLDNGTIITWDCEEDREIVEYAWVTPITEDVVSGDSLIPKNPKSVFEETIIQSSDFVLLELNFVRMYVVNQSWGTIILTLEQLQNLFYVKGS